MRFLLTPLREGRRLTLEQLEMRVHISTHAPAGGATSGAGANGIARSHFYSRPCGRGDAHGRTYGSFRQISTHAPAGGATRGGWPVIGLDGEISTHAPAGGATRTLQPRTLGALDFYSRPCGRGDGVSQWCGVTISDFYSRPCGRGDGEPCNRELWARWISTHAPAGGATNAS